MARLDIKTLVLAFEKRITELEKNPPDQVPISVVLTLLEKAIGEVIQEHFQENIKKELKEIVLANFKEQKDQFIQYAIEEVLENEDFHNQLVSLLKHKIQRCFE